MYTLIKTCTDTKNICNIISKKLLSEKLSPCVQISKASSYYLWKNKINNSKEYIISIKASNKNINKIIKTIKKYHNYDIPEIIQSEFKILNSNYEKWFNDF